MSEGTESMALPDAPPTVVVDVSWNQPDGGVSLYVLCADEDGTVVSQEQAVYAKSPRLEGDGVVLRVARPAPGMEKSQVQVCRDLVPPHVSRIELVLSSSRPGAVLTQSSEITVTVWDPRDGKTLMTRSVPDPGLKKRSELGQLRRSQAGWDVQVDPVTHDYDFATFFQSRFRGAR